MTVIMVHAAPVLALGAFAFLAAPIVTAVSVLGLLGVAAALIGGRHRG